MARPHVLVAFVDWSAASAPRPARPSPDACWLAFGLVPGSERSRRRPSAPAAGGPPEYFRTRHACLARLRSILVDHAGPALVGVDFSLGYPVGEDGEPLLPVGRALARWLAARVEDRCTNANNRFEVATALNRRLSRRIGGPGPFWACPPRAEGPHLTVKRPASPAPEWRLVEASLRARGHRPHSSWKLYTTGSVGSQTLLGLAALGRWLDDPALGPRLRLWPFDDGFRRPRGRRTIVVGEAWPSLMTLPAPGPGVPDIKDARQVVALRDAAAALEDPWAPLGRPPRCSAAAVAKARQEGWIMGLPHPIACDTRATEVRAAPLSKLRGPGHST